MSFREVFKQVLYPGGKKNKQVFVSLFIELRLSAEISEWPIDDFYW